MKGMLISTAVFIVVLVAYIVALSFNSSPISDINTNTNMTLEEKEMFKLGASMYRTEMLQVINDSLLFKIDSLFIEDVLDYDKKLGIEIKISLENDF